MFIQIQDGFPVGFPVTDANLRQVIPSNVALPQYPLSKDVLPFGFAVYEFAQIPEVNPADFKIVEEGAPQWTNDELRGDFITQVWLVRDMTQDERATAIEKQWETIRLQRNRKLMLCDWTQLSDTPLPEEEKAAWANYRQALRDVTTQSDPFTIIWPEEP